MWLRLSRYPQQHLVSSAMAQAKKKSSSRVTSWPEEARAAAKAFKGIKVAKVPAKLQSKNAAAIKRAVKDYYRG